MKSNKVIPIIMCGGSGTRLWPLSRESFPKQFLAIGADQSNSLLQNTQLRISSLDNISNPILVCNEEHRFIVAEQIREINIKNYSILLEPVGRNTAAAITVAALKALQQDEDPILLVMASDHEIQDGEFFIKALKVGISYAIKNRLVTFGILPTSPETGYGYIKSNNPLSNSNLKGEKIEQFLEKPTLDEAKKLIKDKRYSWNSGIFMFKAKTLLNEIQKFEPDIYEHCKESLSKSIKDLDFQRLDKFTFENCPNISFDIAVMEKTNIGTVLPLNCGWNDIGSWKTVWENSKKDEDGNFSKGKVISEKTKNCYLRSENKLLVGIGINNLIVVDTNDAILVSNKNDSQLVKKVVKTLKDRNINEGQKHSKIFRPWGHYQTIVDKSRWQVKLIYVKPGEKLSLQMHHHRSEHWVVVDGTANVELDNTTKILAENESIYIPLGSKHRLSNPGKIGLILIEVQSGSYVGEDDIVRFEDKYGRIK